MEFPIALSVLDFILLLVIFLTSSYLAYKTKGLLQTFSVLVAFTIIVVLFFAPFRIDPESLAAISALGIWAIPVLWAVNTVMPPYPDTELIFIIPLKVFYNVPVWAGELIALGVAAVILFVFSSQFSLVWTIISRNFVTPVILAFSVVWMLLFLGASRYILGEW
jgi:hypothetical protein